MKPSIEASGRTDRGAATSPVVDVNGKNRGRRAPPSIKRSLLAGDARAAITDAIDRAVKVVGQEQRPVRHHLKVHRAGDVIVVLDEPGDERLDRLHAPVLVEINGDNVAADLVGPVPRSVAGDEDRVLVLLREHVAGVEAQAERRTVRAQQGGRPRELVTGSTPTKLGIRQVSLMAERETEVLS